MNFPEMTQEYAKSLFEYKDGHLYWKVNKTTRNLIGMKVGSPINGYYNVMVDGKNWRVHRLVFLMNYGYLPKIVDHINNIRSDNRIENLRAADKYTNAQNTLKRYDNQSGVKGVSWNTERQKWVVRINANKKLHQWYVDCLEFAELLANEARVKFHGEFANKGTLA
jgi:hypothetical protein